MRMCINHLGFFLDFSDIVQRGVVTDTVSVSRATDREGEKPERIADLTHLQPLRLTAQRDWGILNPYIYIYNSVLTCRQNIINSSASAPLNATKIAVKKVSDGDVCMFGPEL